MPLLALPDDVLVEILTTFADTPSKIAAVVRLCRRTRNLCRGRWRALELSSFQPLRAAPHEFAALERLSVWLRHDGPLPVLEVCHRLRSLALWRSDGGVTPTNPLVVATAQMLRSLAAPLERFESNLPVAALVEALERHAPMLTALRLAVSNWPSRPPSSSLSPPPSASDQTAALVARCAELRELTLEVDSSSSGRLLTQETAQLLDALGTLPHLAKLKLHCRALNDAHLAKLAASSPTLTSLSLLELEHVTALGLVSALRALPHLAHLELGAAPWANAVVKLGDALRFERLTSLRSVHLQYGLGPVRVLSFAGCAALRTITSEPTLKITFLNLCGTSVGAACIEALMPKLPELLTLFLRKCAALDGRLAISRHMTLQRVDLLGCAALRHLHISNCLQLEHLAIGGCAALETLELRHLRRLSFPFSLDLATMRPHPLRELKLPSCVLISDADVAAIAASCPALEEVDLSYCVDVGDGAVAALARCAALRSLSLLNCRKVADVSPLVDGCPNLVALDLRWCTRVDDEVVQRVVAAHPQLDCDRRPPATSPGGRIILPTANSKFFP
jgi:hypothetical protein